MPGGTGGGSGGDRTQRGREKKLVVAFHFQFANQAAWECDACRKSGLEKKRRCGWLGMAPQGVVWARRDVVVGACPKSYVTAESVGFIEEFLVRRQLGGVPCERISARKAEAFIVLTRELDREMAMARR